MNLDSTILGGLFGAGVLLIYLGARRMMDKTLEESARKKGFWPLNGGLILAVLSMYLISQSGNG
jgi:hypothetical protein